MQHGCSFCAASYFIQCVHLDGDYACLPVDAVWGITLRSWCFIDVPQQLPFFISLPVKTDSSTISVYCLLSYSYYVADLSSVLNSFTDCTCYTNISLHVLTHKNRRIRVTRNKEIHWYSVFNADLFDLFYHMILWKQCLNVKGIVRRD